MRAISGIDSTRAIPRTDRWGMNTQQFAIRDRGHGHYLVETSRHRGSQAGNGRIWSEEQHRAQRFDSRAQAEDVLAQEFEGLRSAFEIVEVGP